MPRISEAIDDPTPITGPRIDVPARIGWLMRVHRTVAGLSLREMAAAMRALDMRVSSTTLSRLENEGQRSYPVLDGYTTVLGLEDGALRSVVDMMCRSFPYSPAPLPEHEIRSLDRFSEACERVDAPHPAAGDWHTFARLHAADDGFGLPRALAEPYVRRLADELGRALGRSHITRYEALAQLRTSAYGDLVASVCRELILDPDTQVLYHLTSILSDVPSLDVVGWSGALLRHPSTFVARGGAYALQNMLVIGGLGILDWRTLIPDIAAAWEQADGDPMRHGILTQLCAALPPVLQDEVRTVVDLPAAQAPGPRDWSRTRGNPHYEFARSVAAAACARLGHREEPMLERLLFEALFDPRGVRMSSAMVTLSGTPFAGVLTTLLTEAHAEAPDEATRAAVRQVVRACHPGDERLDLGPWLEAEDPREFDFALAISGLSGRRLPGAALERGLAGDVETVDRTMYALGMAADPRLRGLARDATASDPVRRAAKWWAQRDGRILV